MDRSSRISVIADRIAQRFFMGNWRELGNITRTLELIEEHPRLLRSLSFGDPDYPSNVYMVVDEIITKYPDATEVIENYLDEKFPLTSEYISSKPNVKRITFAPLVFRIPEATVEADLLAVMMPFRKEFDRVYEAIQNASVKNGLRCLRVDEMWGDATIIQDIFNLVYTSSAVVVDFTGKNPNVMYETGIAHTLGKDVFPITQNLDDIPFDMVHHRALRYFPNSEGLEELSTKLSSILWKNNVPF
jgi:hypothetical protein